MHPSARGADRVRTDDLFVANEALSQLSYSPASLDQNKENLSKKQRLILFPIFPMMHPGNRNVKMTKSENFAEFVQIVRRLRKECPWDREQTHESLRHSLVEETYEVLESIEEKNLPALKGELGDLMLHILLHSIIAEEERAFTLDEVISAIAEKMVRRHPHVFGSSSAPDANTVSQNWEHIKMAEGRESVLDGVPTELPALLRAWRLQEKASKVGFDWERKEDVWKKLEEETAELHTAAERGDPRAVEDELGDLLFSIVNYARFVDTNPEFALRRTCEKFIGRFTHIERRLAEQGKKPSDVTLEELDALWNEGKRNPGLL